MLNNIKHLEISDNYKEISIDETSIIYIDHMVSGELLINASASANILFVIKDQDLKRKITINLIQPSIEVNVKFLAITKENQEFNVDFKAVHKAVRTDCDFKFFGFAFGDSFLGIKANNTIEKGNKESNTHQLLKVISDQNAKVKGEPGLFIDEFDVSASHGNSIGQIDQRSLYYLQTRGISRTKARWIIVEGEVKALLEGFDPSIVTSTLKELQTIMGVHHE